MFSGIIEHQARIISRDGGRFTVENTFADDLMVGQSIAHDGACMTLTSWTPAQYEFFVMEESLTVTNFGSKKGGDTFNVERSLKLGDRIDGHMVTGHVDTVGIVNGIKKRDDGSMLLSVNFDKKYKNLLVKKGSITINGTSLTLIDAGEDTLSVSLIPLTQDWTNLGQLIIGDKVNLEFDMLGKYVQNILQK